MPSTRPFVLEALCDFPDDALMAPGPITAEHVDSLMRLLAEAGVRRVSWGSYGDGHGGWLLPDGLSDEWTHLARTLDILGNPLRVAVEAGHRHGLEVYGYFKPYETGVAFIFPEGTPQARAYGRLWRQGGYLAWLDPFVVRHPHLRLRRRRDAALAPQRPVCAIRLTKRDDAPTRITADHLQIWTSELNYRYQRAQVDFRFVDSVEASPRDVRDLDGNLLTAAGDPVRVLTLSGFCLRDRYLLVTTDFQDGPADFENTGLDMMTALDEDGREIPGVFANGAAVWEGDRVDFREWGVIFDFGYTRQLVRLDAPNEAPPSKMGYGSGRQGLIAFTAGRNEYLPGALCETEPAVQACWLDWVREMIEAGVDGIDLRVENHSAMTDFPEEYGYNDVVLERAAERDPRDPPAAVPAVRGEAYTDFLRQAKALASAHGKRLRVNLNIDFFRPDPSAWRLNAYPLNIDFDWECWVREGLMDAGILRFYHLPFECLFDDPVARAMIEACHQRHVPLVVNRYIDIGGDACEAEFRRVREDGRFDGFILYETARMITWRSDPATMAIDNAPVRAVIAAAAEGG